MTDSREGVKRVMAEFVPVTKVSDLSPGQMKWVAVNRERVLLVNVEGMFYALSDACGHQRVPLSEAIWKQNLYNRRPLVIFMAWLRTDLLDKRLLAMLLETSKGLIY
jgi:Rieske [2Fe-2S] domain